MATTLPTQRAQPSLARRLSTHLYQRPKLVLALLLGPPLLWLGVVYVGSLLALMLQSFYRLDSFTGQVVREFTLDNYLQLFSASHIGIMARTSLMAAIVTLAAIGLAFPLAYYMARYASPRAKSWLYLLVLIPLWSSYLVRVFAWKLILAKEGVFTWFVNLLGLGGALDSLLAVPGIGGTSLSVSNLGIFIVFVYVWLPYMILP
ncbi:MAG: ABC transporter permease, partial [Chloroflexi bacterium]|nr:ABC transporter permease [Chloroflexota bacterium]